jgi:hypothetical protein
MHRAGLGGQVWAESRLVVGEDRYMVDLPLAAVC